jgi:hypothetical protein
MQGGLSIENFVYTENDSPYSLPKINLRIDQLGGINQHVRLNSDVLDIELKGEFTYKHVVSTLQKQVHDRLSNLVPPPAFFDTNSLQKFETVLNMKKNIPLLAHFFPIVTATKGMRAKLSMNEVNNSLSLDLDAPQLNVYIEGKQGKDTLSLGLEKPKLKGINQLISNLSVRINWQSDMFDVKANCDEYRLNKTDSVVADAQGFSLHSSINDNIITFTTNVKGNNKNKLLWKARSDLRQKMNCG